MDYYILWWAEKQAVIFDKSDKTVFPHGAGFPCPTRYRPVVCGRTRCASLPPALVRGVPPVRRPGGGGSPYRRQHDRISGNIPSASRTARPGLHDDGLSEIRWRFPRQSSDWFGMTCSDGPRLPCHCETSAHTGRGNLPVQRNQGTTPAKTATPPVTGRGNLHRLTGLRPSFPRPPGRPAGVSAWPL